MFWSKTKKVETAYIVSIADKVAGEAEEIYRLGKHHCAEAVLMAIRANFRPDVSEEVVLMASGFWRRVRQWLHMRRNFGGTMALGLVLQDDKRRVRKLTRELHSWFREIYGITCCKVILEPARQGLPGTDRTGCRAKLRRCWSGAKGQGCRFRP